jgi:hypothetical protein
VILVPNLVGGSGISTKTLLALEHTIPFVTTARGVTGVEANRTAAAFHVRDDAAGFADAAAQVYSDQKLWTETAAAMHAHVVSHLSKRQLAAAVQQTIYTATSERCVSPSWTAESLAARDRHRLVRLQRQHEEERLAASLPPASHPFEHGHQIIQMRKRQGMQPRSGVRPKRGGGTAFRRGAALSGQPGGAPGRR